MGRILTPLGKELGKIALSAGHLDGQNRIPAKFQTNAQRKTFSEGTNNRLIAEAVNRLYPNSALVRPPTLVSQFYIRALNAKRAGCRTYIAIHSNWSLHDANTPNHGTIIIFYSVHRPGDEAIAWQIGRAIQAEFPELKLGLAVKVRRSTDGTTDYYGEVYNPIKRMGLAHCFLIEHAYHIDWCDYMPMDQFRARVLKAYDKLLYLPETTPPPPPPKPADPHGYAVQVGAYEAAPNADKTKSALLHDGFAKAFILPATVDGKTVYRVYAGIEATEAAANVILAQAKRDGYGGFIRKL